MISPKKCVIRRRIDGPVTVAFIALGCPKNIVDSERMLAQIAQGGLSVAVEPDPRSCLQQEDAGVNVVVINTCGFIAPAKAEALEANKTRCGLQAEWQGKKGDCCRLSATVNG